MNERVERLLKPVSTEQPCGPDLSNDPRFDELQTILRGTPEVEIGTVQKPAEPPDWRELKEKSEQFFALSKDLRVAVMWCCSSLRIDGVPGFRDGVWLIKALLEQNWAAVHPVLDPEDKDPTQRLNILGALTAPRGSASGWLTILDYLYAAPVSTRRGGSPVLFETFLTAPAAGGATSAEVAQAGAAIREGGMEQVAANHKALQEAAQSLSAIDTFLTSTLGATGTISFEELQKTLESMSKVLTPFLPGAAPSDSSGAEAGAAAGQQSVAGGPAIAIQGSVRSREEVLRTLDNICEYYRQVEPSSPVPFLLRRAQKIVNMNFVQAVQELNFATLDSLRPIIGAAADGTQPPQS